MARGRGRDRSDPLGYRFFRNAGERNAPHDRYVKTELTTLADGGSFFDLLALPELNPTPVRVSKPARLSYEDVSPRCGTCLP
jgi:hypothetical protein